MKTLGILGGVGPETTSKIYESVISAVRESGSKIYPPILIFNLPYAFAWEEEMILQGKIDNILPNLVHGTKLLEASGADFVILPCNTLHPHIDTLRRAVKIPVLSIVEETAVRLTAERIIKVGVLGTKATMKYKLYNRILRRQGIQVMTPSQADQRMINKIIVDLVRGKHTKNHEQIIKRICASLQKQGAESILFACTDLQLINVGSKIPIIDSTEVLINASVREIIST